MATAWDAWLSMARLDAQLGGPMVARLLALGTDGIIGEVRPGPNEALQVDFKANQGYYGVRPGVFQALAQPNPQAGTMRGQCTCHGSWGGNVCEHVARLLIFVASHPPLARAALSGGDVSARMRELPALLGALSREKVLLRSLEHWAGPSHVDAIDFAIEPTRGASGHAETAQPALLVRVRRAGARGMLSMHELERISLNANDTRTLELLSFKSGKAMVAEGPLASMLLEELRPRGTVPFGSFTKQVVTFSDVAVRPRVRKTLTNRADGSAESLVGEWVSESGELLALASTTLLYRGRFPFLFDVTRRRVHPVAESVDLGAAARLQAIPVIELPKADHSTTAGKILYASMSSRGVDLPPREELGLAAVETPRVVLSLSGTPLDVRGRLEAVYSSRKVVLPAVADASSERDLDTETAAVALLARNGFVTGETDGRPTHGVSGDSAIALWQRGVLELRAWTRPVVEVRLTERLARVRVGAPLRAKVRIAMQGSWLDAKVDFATDDVAVEMAAVKAALAKGTRWVTLSDGALSRISDEVAALAEEAGELLHGGQGLVGAHQLGRLSRWVDEHGGTVDDAVSAFRERLRSLAVGSAKLPPSLKNVLRAYQRRGVAWLQFLEELGAGGILADDMGLGKTLMTLAFISQRKSVSGHAPSLVVCPTSVAPGWIQEAARFTPELRTTLFHGAARDAEAIASSDLVVTTYAIVRRDIEALSKIPFRFVVADEAQNIKNPEAATTHAVKRLRGELRLALSGTPVENRLRELWSLLDFANPGMLATHGAFERRFERPIVENPTGPRASELRAVIRPFVLRRTKGEVLVDLPPKTEIERPCILDVPHKRLYDALALTLRESVSKKIAEVGMARAGMNVLTALLRLRQMSCDPRLVDPDSVVVSAKRTAFLEIVRELVAEGRRALVFSQFVELLRLWRIDLHAENIAYEYLDGSSTDRSSIVERFQNGVAPLFLISLKAGGTGLNLTAADTVIHCDPWWNPAVEDQATDRAHRIGQDKPVTVIRLVAAGTVEEKISALKATKRTLADSVIGATGDGALRGLSEDDLRSLLGDSEGEADAEPEALKSGPERRESEEMAELGRIARAWLSEGRTQRMLGEHLGVAQGMISKLVRGQLESINPENAKRIRALAQP